MNYTYTKVEKTNWILYILNMTGWEAGYGTVYEEVHIIMPKAFSETGSYADMAACPHITMVDKKGWTYHRYESSGRKYQEKNRLVKKGSTSYSSAVYPATSSENNLVKLIAADIGTMTRP